MKPEIQNSNTRQTEGINNERTNREQRCSKLAKES